jgi:hypothetical protein
MSGGKFGAVQVHKFGNQVAAYIGVGPNPAWGRKKTEACTAYMSPAEAIALAGALIHAAQCVNRDESPGTYSAQIEGDRTL